MSEAATTQTPIIGRIVHYLSYGTPKGEYKSVPRAAVITEVHDAENVGLCVLNPTGQFFNQSVKFGTEAGQWSWPPRT